jgi:hypothetical protein
MAPRTENEEQKTAPCLRKFGEVDFCGTILHGTGFVNSGRPTICCSVVVIRQKEFSMPSCAGFGVIKGDFVNALRRGQGVPVRRSIEGIAA